MVARKRLAVDAQILMGDVHFAEAAGRHPAGAPFGRPGSATRIHVCRPMVAERSSRYHRRLAVDRQELQVAEDVGIAPSHTGAPPPPPADRPSGRRVLRFDKVADDSVRSYDGVSGGGAFGGGGRRVSARDTAARNAVRSGRPPLGARSRHRPNF